jgi:multidrug efflux pump subunit AcrA (membrane-fusion protein)
MVKRWARRLVLAVVGVGLLAALVYAFMPGPVTVDVAQASRGLLRVSVDEDGRTRIKERYVVSAPLAGRLTRINLKAGATVADRSRATGGPGSCGGRGAREGGREGPPAGKYAARTCTRR